MLKKEEFVENPFMWRLSTTVAVVSGLFSIVVFALLVTNYLQILSADPINDPLITELRDAYASTPERDEALAQQIRDLDLLTRKAFFTSQGHLRMGGFLLLGGVVAFLLAFKNMARWRPEIPELSETPAAEAEWHSHALSRKLITWTGVAVLAVGLAASFFTESALTPATAIGPGNGDPSVAQTIEPAEKVYPTWEEMQLNWPTFRGPGANGVAHFTNAPVEWNVETGAGIRWKVTLPKSGTNSPVVWGNRLFLSGADEEVREVYCFDTETGELLWTSVLTPFPGTPADPPAVSEETGYAAPTMAAHGEQVVALFANGDIVSHDFDGNEIWGRNLGLPDNHYGHSSSLLAFENLVYVQYDQSSNGKLLALDLATGRTVWEARRELISWSSPILAHTPFGVQVILNNEENVDAYDPQSGELLWSVVCMGGEVAPSPAYSNGIVFAANEFATANAIELTGSAEAVMAEILWEYDELLPEVASPVGDGERFYFATAIGDLVALDAMTGEELWAEELDYGFYSSPILVGDRIYVLDMEGAMLIARAGAEFERIASPSMDEGTLATPAYLDGRIYVRTAEHLICIE